MKKVRLSVLLGEAILCAIAIVAMVLDFKEVATGAVVGITALLPKLVELENNS